VSADRAFTAAMVQMRTGLLPEPSLEQGIALVREAALKSNVNYPILMDHAQLVAESLGIRKSGSVVVLDPEKPDLLYKGPVQEQLGKVLEAKLSGAAVPMKTLPVQTGCAIDFPAPPGLECARANFAIIRRK